MPEMTEPLVSVIINCYNSEKYLRETLDSLIAQTYTNWEAIFWDNCSTDSTADIIRSYQEPRFRYFKAEVNTPLGHARNLAMEKMEGEYFGFLDSDDVWTKDYLKTGVSALLDDKECVGFYCNYYNWYDGVTERENNKGWPSGVHGLDWVVRNYGLAMSGVICSTQVARSNNIRFNQHYQLVEDMDFFLQFLAFGNFRYDSRPLTYYRVYTENNSHKLRERWAVEYADIYDRLYELFVNTPNPRLSADDLSYIKIQEISCRAEDCVTQNRRRDLIRLLYQNRKILPFRYCRARLVFILTGKAGYSLLTKIKNRLR